MNGSSRNGFGDREKAFEAKYEHDEELNFRITARRNRLFGLWAAELLGYHDEEAEAYVDEVLLVELQKKHKEGVLHKVISDLLGAEVDLSEHRIRKQFDQCWEEARQSILKKDETSDE